MTNTNDSAQSPKLIWIALFSTLASVLTHIYLYSVHIKTAFGLGENAICDLSQKFSCTAVIGSGFSEVFTIPVAMFGATTNLILLIMLVGFQLFSTNNKQIDNCFWFSLPILLASLVMGTISFTLMDVYCPFCLLLYGLSIVTFLSLWRYSKVNIFKDLFSFLKTLNWTKTLIIYVTILGTSWLANSIVRQSTGLAELEKMEAVAIQEWQVSTEYDFSALKGIDFGSSSSNIQFRIIEFADFLCSHCQVASGVFHDFLETHPTASLQYFTFPLDGCETMGPNCLASKNAFCANQLGKGPDAHSLFFKNLVGAHGLTEIEQKIAQSVAELNIAKDDLENCVKSPETDLAIKRLINAGKQAGVKGTPSVFVNGRHLPYGHRKSVLEKAYQSLQLK